MMGFMSVSGMIRRYSCPTRVRSWEGTKDRVRAISQKLESAIAVNNVLAIAPAKKREDLIPSFSILLFANGPQLTTAGIVLLCYFSFHGEGGRILTLMERRRGGDGWHRHAGSATVHRKAGAPESACLKDI